MNSIKLSCTAFALTCLFAATGSKAQMSGGSVFLKGNFVEAGICANGDFGAAAPPAGYHPHTSSTTGGPLGFVADPAMDGWTTGTPAYCGDFFTPGSPFEGWNLQIGAIRAQAHSCTGFAGTGSLTGANTAYSVSGSKVIGTWEGSFDSMTVRQVTTLDTLGLYFSMKITLINTSSVAKNNIYYLRSLDPDNDQSWPGGGFPTKNKIEYQQPNPLNATTVSARGLGDTTAYVSLGTADTNARCLIYAAWPIASSVDLATVYGMSYGGTYAAGSVVTNDVAIGIIFKVDHIASIDSAADSVGFKPTMSGHKHPANEASFTYFYAFSRDAVDSAIVHLTDTGSGPVTPPPPTAITSVNSVKEVKVYPNPAGDQVNVTGLATTDKLALYDLMGRHVSDGWKADDRPVNTFSMRDIPTGSYVLTVWDEHGNLKARVPVRKQ